MIKCFPHCCSILKYIVRCRMVKHNLYVLYAAPVEIDSEYVQYFDMDFNAHRIYAIVKI